MLGQLKSSGIMKQAEKCINHGDVKYLKLLSGILDFGNETKVLRNLSGPSPFPGLFC